jgi:hypothetical protein
MKRRCNALILQGALALLLIVHSVVAWTGEADLFQDQVGEYVSTLKKSSIVDGEWSEDNNKNEKAMLLDRAVIDQSADDEEELSDDSVAENTIASSEQRWLKGKKGKKATKKNRKKKAPKTPAPTVASTGAPTCPPTRFVLSPKGKGSKKKTKKSTKKSLVVCITPNPTANPTASPTCSPTPSPTRKPTPAPVLPKKKKATKKATKKTTKKKKRILVSPFGKMFVFPFFFSNTLFSFRKKAARGRSRKKVAVERGEKERGFKGSRWLSSSRPVGDICFPKEGSWGKEGKIHSCSLQWNEQFVRR